MFLFQDFQKTVAAERARLASAAAAFSAAVSSAVAADDRHGTLQVLRGIRALPNTTYVVVETSDGQTFAEIGGGVTLSGRDGVTDGRSALDIIRSDTIITRVAIVNRGTRIGTLKIHTGIESLRADLFADMSKMLAAGLLVVVLTLLAAAVSVRWVTRPLRSLTDTLIDMRDNPDLSLRFSHQRNDEVGVLAAAFNDAFAGIEDRDNALRRHRDTLEETVDMRTRELRVAVDEPIAPTPPNPNSLRR